MISFSNPGNVIKQVMAAPDGYESITGLAKAVLILCFGVVCVGCLLNKGDLKFSRSHTTDCSKGLLALNLEDSHICCDSPSHESNWICIASFDSLNYVFSSRWAFVIPLVPWVLNSALCDKRIVDSAKRIFVYVVLIAIRTVLLYKLPSLVQDWLQSSSSAVCWCPDNVSEKKCRMEFDFSDHIVLSIVQYILPCMLEVHYSLILMQRDRRTLIPWLAVAAAGAIGLLCLRSMLLTCMFFHTFAENAVGFLIASLVAFLPFVAGSKPGAVLWITRTINSNSS